MALPGSVRHTAHLPDGSCHFSQCSRCEFLVRKQSGWSAGGSSIDMRLGVAAHAQFATLDKGRLAAAYRKINWHSTCATCSVKSRDWTAGGSVAANIEEESCL